MVDITQVITNIQEQIYNHNGTRTDVFYTEGDKAIFVPEGQTPEQGNALIEVPYYLLQQGNLTLNFN